MVRRWIFTREYWRDFRRDVKRSGRDKRARFGAAIRLGALVYFLAVLGWYGSAIYGAHDTETYVIVGGMLSIVLVASGGIWISARLDERRVRREDSAATPAGVAERLQRLALGELALTERALSELWLLTHTVPAGFEAHTRRVQIDKLRDADVWDEMPSEARVWMMRPDGEWPQERSSAVLAGAETRHAMLWALFLLPGLRRLDQLAEPLQFQKIAKALRGRARGVRPTWDLRVARNRAHEFFIRCYAERIHRGLSLSEDEAQRKAVGDWMDGIADGTIVDSFAGDLTIAEIDADSLDMVGRSAARRLLTLSAIMTVMENGEGWEKLSGLIYGALGAEAAEESAEEASSSS